jgi:N-acetylmuramoyl-L-alanine amidase
MKVKTMAKLKKVVALCTAFVCACQIVTNWGFVGMSTVEAAGKSSDPVVIVIDPGHGGENTGTQYLPIDERYYDMQIAKYLKDYLETYDNVEVYMTHDSAEYDVSFPDRAAFAESVNADFLFSIHLNMSLNHYYYGSEVWIPSEGELYSKGYSVANEFLTEFEDIGLFNRGIKTRIGENGDYYAIIRYCAALNIPAVIVEHCHVDNVNDISHISNQEALKQLALADSNAIAKYFGLVSKDGTIDYSNYKTLDVAVPESRVYNDTTPPTYVNANLLYYDKSGRYATVQLTAYDDETALNYYTYSTDGGNTWAALKPWNKTTSTMNINLILDFGKKDSLIFKVYDMYDNSTISNVVSLK